MSSPPPKTHRLTDHFGGAEAMHTHEEGEESDHDHDHFGDADDIENNAIWIQDNITLTSVGIDIGSSGTQVIFSRIKLRRMGEDLTSRYFVVGRETLYHSPVALTPYRSDSEIDEAALGKVIDDAYTAAGIHPDDIDTGAVILTGEALRRENAAAIGAMLAEMGGEFVCATAGHHMEATLAAYGSGAAKVSHDRSLRVLNIDIGGGTTKLAVLEGGKVVETAAIHLGGRLLVVGANGQLTRLDPTGQYLAKQAGFDWALASVVTDVDLDKVAAWMADALTTALHVRPSPDAIEDLYLTAPLARLTHIDGVMFSGGVGEYVYAREDRDFSDLGKRLGQAIRARIENGKLPWSLLPAGECIRATALGASEYSVQLSGNTVYISSPADLLPRKNLQVLQPRCRLDDEVDMLAVSQAIRAHFTAFDLVEGESVVALAFRWRGDPSFTRISAFAMAITMALPNTIKNQQPIYLILDGDVAQTLGGILKEDWNVASEVLVLDGISLWDFDFIDLGRIRMPSFTVPVTIKSLVFSEDPRLPHVHGKHHHAHA